MVSTQSASKNNAPAHSRVVTLDGIRGIAAIAVFTLHYGVFFWPVTRQQSFLAVDLFFILSGYVLSKAYSRRLQSGMLLASFVYLRVVRVYPLYLLGVAISVAVLLYTGEYRLGELIPFLSLAAFILPNLFIAAPGTKPNLFPLNGPSWSLFLELAANLFYAAMLPRLTRRWIVAVMAVSALGLVGSVAVFPRHSLNFGFTLYSLPGGFCRVGYSFFAGVLLARDLTYRPVASRSSAVMPYVILAIVGAILAAEPSDALLPYYDLIAVTLVFPALIALGVLFQPNGAGTRLFVILGQVSYPLYMLQGPLSGVIKTVVRAVYSLPITSDWDGLEVLGAHAPWVGFALLGALLLVCWALDVWVDEPLRRWLLRKPRARAETTTPTLPEEVERARVGASG